MASEVWSDWTDEEITEFRKELARAIASGAFIVRANNRTVQYRSLEEMRAIQQDLTDYLGAQAGRRRKRRVYIDSIKGI